jgi:hypothetical protein
MTRRPDPADAGNVRLGSEFGGKPGDVPVRDHDGRSQDPIAAYLQAKTALGQRQGPPDMGDLFVLLHAKVPVEWAVLVRSTDATGSVFLIVVPSDWHPLVGAADVAVPPDAAGSRRTLRCGLPLNIPEPYFRQGRRSGLIDRRVCATALRRVCWAYGDVPSTSEDDEAMDDLPAYEEWMTVIQHAVGLVSESIHRVLPSSPATLEAGGALLGRAVVAQAVKHACDALREPALHWSDAVRFHDVARGELTMCLGGLPASPERFMRFLDLLFRWVRNLSGWRVRLIRETAGTCDHSHTPTTHDAVHCIDFGDVLSGMSPGPDTTIRSGAADAPRAPWRSTSTPIEDLRLLCSIKAPGSQPPVLGNEFDSLRSLLHGRGWAPPPVGSLHHHRVREAIFHDIALGDLADGRSRLVFDPSRMQTLEGRSGAVGALARTADGRGAIWGSTDRSLKIWDLDTGKVLHAFEGLLERVRAVAAATDGQLAVSGSDDRTLKVWALSSARMQGAAAAGSDWCNIGVRLYEPGAGHLHGEAVEHRHIWSERELEPAHRGGSPSGSSNLCGYLLPHAPRQPSAVITTNFDRLLEPWPVVGLDAPLVWLCQSHAAIRWAPSIVIILHGRAGGGKMALARFLSKVAVRITCNRAPAPHVEAPFIVAYTIHREAVVRAHGVSASVPHMGPCDLLILAGSLADEVSAAGVVGVASDPLASSDTTRL